VRRKSNCVRQEKIIKKDKVYEVQKELLNLAFKNPDF